VDDAPTVRLVTTLLVDAVRVGASDVHVEPQRGDLRIRYRVDGVMRDVMTLPRSATPAITSRIKIVSGLDIAERRLPQDGRTRFVVDGRPVDARVSTMPAIHGEKVVVRLLTRSDQVPAVDAVGLDPDQLAAVRSAVAGAQGLVIVTGPTGSGKTSTLYSLLPEVDVGERNVVSLEDPVEVQFPGITQVQVHERAGLTFSRGLRAVLRQDPDVVLVGEIRDSETAELAVRASLTGHLVLTTMHTNSTVAAMTRFLEMGIEPFMVGSSLEIVVAQRLVRRPCHGCTVAYEPDPALLRSLGVTEDRLEGASPVRGVGCIECGQTGYRGRLGVFEVLRVDQALRRVLANDPSERAIADAAAGLVTLRESAVRKALRGETTFDEVARVSPRP
jgi:type IV pilus assembly protein PilB